MVRDQKALASADAMDHDVPSVDQFPYFRGVGLVLLERCCLTSFQGIDKLRIRLKPAWFKSYRLQLRQYWSILLRRRVVHHQLCHGPEETDGVHLFHLGGWVAEVKVWVDGWLRRHVIRAPSAEGDKFVPAKEFAHYR